MRFLADLRTFWRSLGRIGQIFAVSLILSLALRPVPALDWLASLAQFTAVISGIVFAFRLIQATIRRSIWRLRNRLMVTYLFIALVPVILLLGLGFAATWAMSGQVAVYLVTAEFDRRLDLLRRISLNVLRSPAASSRQDGVERLGAVFAERAPGVEVLLTSGREYRYPPENALQHPDAAWKDARGVVSRDGELFGWVNAEVAGGRLTVVVPLSQQFLGTLVPDLGEVSVVSIAQEGPAGSRKKMRARGEQTRIFTEAVRVPMALNSFDREVLWGSPIEVADWENPGKDSPALFAVRTRISAVMKVLFSQKTDWDNSYALLLIATVGIAFLLVELVALLVGISLSRSITFAVHNLYEGTERVMEGDFSHRIQPKGRDQVAALGNSFNRMTENVERLLQVAKEKERYEAELAIAREIQAQLYPRSVPESQLMSLTALYKPARMVSGDYFDYRRIATHSLALAIGDVAGKGISAALLMATIQSAFRSRLSDCGDGRIPETAEMVSHLNLHLHANTPPEKYATFFVGIFDEQTSVLTYTNAGHLQPVLVRGDESLRLEVDGMVIGAFPFAKYGTSNIKLLPGDLIVWFTDGISEPENEYGEMFGEERLAELVTKIRDRSNSEIVEEIADAVERWTGTPELQDDMTLLLARCL